MAVHKKKHFNEFVLREELKEELKRIEALRTDTVISLRKRNWSVRGLLFAGAVVFFLILWRTLPPVGGPMGLTFAVLGLSLGELYLIKGTGGAKLRYAQEYKKAVGLHLLRKLELGLEYRPDYGVTEETFLSAGFYSRDDYTTYWSEDCLEGHVGGTQVQMAEVQAKRETEDSFTEIFCGWFMMADFPQPFRTPVVVGPRAEKSRSSKLWSLLPLSKQRPLSSQTFGESMEEGDDSDFEKRFVVHAADPEEMAALLTPALKQRMLAFRTSRGSEVRFAFRNNQLMIAIPNRVKGKDWFDPSPRKPASDLLQLNAIAGSFLKQTSACFEIVAELNLGKGT